MGDDVKRSLYSSGSRPVGLWGGQIAPFQIHFDLLTSLHAPQNDFFPYLYSLNIGYVENKRREEQ